MRAHTHHSHTQTRTPFYNNVYVRLDDFMSRERAACKCFGRFGNIILSEKVSRVGFGLGTRSKICILTIRLYAYYILWTILYQFLRSQKLCHTMHTNILCSSRTSLRLYIKYSSKLSSVIQWVTIILVYLHTE